MNIETYLNALAAYFIIIDPIGASLVFNSLTIDKDKSASKIIAFRAVTVSFIIIAGFGFFGGSLLSHLGVAMESFRIAGGLFLFHSAFSLVTHPDVASDNAQVTPTSDISVFPLSFPLSAGPGCLTLTILLFSEAGQMEYGIISVLLAIITVLIMMLVCFLLSKNLMKTIGKTANSVMKRLLGVLLASLAIQFIADGIKGFINQS